jgi:hypothetical protein
MKKRMFGAFEGKRTFGCALVAVFAVFQAAGAELFVDATGNASIYKLSAEFPGMVIIVR